MKKLLTLLLVLSLLLSPVLAAGEADATAESAAYDGFLVTLNRPADELSAMSVAPDGAAYVTDDVCLVPDRQGVRELADLGLAVSCEPNYILTAQGWSTVAVSASAAWNHLASDNATYDLRGTGVTVAVIDSGVYAAHTDLKSANILAYKDYTASTAGYTTYHGTFVTGVIAAQLGDSNGVDGVSPDVNILPLCVLDASENTTTDKVVAAIDYAIENNASVINLSLGGPSGSSVLETACRKAIDAGVIVVASAGNYKSSASKSAANYMYPASCDGVVSVSACKQTASGVVFDSDYSYYNDKVTVCAPGTAVTSLSIASDTAVKTDSGTSFSAPMVSAMAAIAKEKNSAVTAAQFKSLLALSSDDLGDSGFDVQYGFGLIDMTKFVDCLTKTYSVSYRSGDGAAAFADGTTPVSGYTFSSAEVPLPTPARSGFTFLGWYESADFSGSAVDVIPTGSCGDRTYYARWESESEAGVASVTVAGYAAAWSDADGRFEITVPKGTAVTASQIAVAPASAGASVSTPAYYQAEGLWRFTVSSASGYTKKTWALLVSEDTNAAPALKAPAAVSGSAAPASLDGKTAAAPYAADVSGWFTDADGDALTYSVVSCSGAASPALTAAGALSYTPAAADAGTNITIVLRAADAKYASPDATVTLDVGALPVSNSVFESGDALAVDLYALTQPLSLPLTLYGNTVAGVSLTASGGASRTLTASQYAVSGSALTIPVSVLSSLTVGGYTLTVSFSAGADASRTLTVTDSAPVYYVSFNTEGTTSIQNVRSGSCAVLPTPQKSGYAFQGWFTGAGGSGTKLLATTPVTANWTVFAYFTASSESGGGGGGGAGGGGGGSMAAASAEPVVSSGTTSAGLAVTTITCPASSAGGVSSVSLSASDAAGLLAAAVKNKSAELVLAVSDVLSGDAASVSLPVSLLTDALAATDASLTISAPHGAVTLSREAMKSLAGSGTLTVTLKRAAASGLSAAERALYPGAVSVLTFSIRSNGSDASYTGALTVRIPADTPAAGKAYRVFSGGGASGQDMDAAYSPADGAVEFTAAGGSSFILALTDGDSLPFFRQNGKDVFLGFAAYENGVVRSLAPDGAALLYKPNPKTFSDMPSGWAAEGIRFVTERDIFEGSGGLFLPDATMTRAMFATILGRLYERSFGPLSSAGAQTFSDCDSSLWYGPYVGWCAENGIIEGSGGLFRPNDPVTRGQMAAMLCRFAAFLKKLPESGTVSLAYPDAAEIPSWAREGAAYCQATGVIRGAANGAFLPNENATRAQAAAVFMRLITDILSR